MDAQSECSFDVRGVTVEELPEDGTFMVALAEESAGGGRLLMFQLGAAFDEQDVAQGQNTYCLCDEMGTTVYGGVTGCALAGNLLTIRLDTEAATALRTGEECRLRLLVDARSVARVAEGLRKIFAGSHPAPPRLEL